MTLAEQRARDERIVAVMPEAADLLWRQRPSGYARMRWEMDLAPGTANAMREYTVETDGMVVLSDFVRSDNLSVIASTGYFNMTTLERQDPVPILSKSGGGWP
jgi:hypothetical protein